MNGTSNPTQRWLIGACFFLSGLSALVYEVLWVRQFELVFGAAAYSMGAVLAAYMGGLGLGGWAGGRFADRVRRPLAVYGLLEIAIGLYALLFPFLYGAAHGAYLGLEAGRDLPAGLSLIVRSFTAVLLLLPPTALMGATLPLLAKAVTRDPARVGKSVGGLYGVNLVGAVMGTLLAGFFWIPSWGLSKTLLLAAAINLVLGAVALWMGKGPGTDPVNGQGQALPREGTLPPDRGLALWVVALSGLSAMVYQTDFTRLLVMTLGASVHAFSAMLSSFLAGLGLGALFISRGRWLRDEGLSFRLGMTLVATGLCALTTGFLVDRLPYFFLWLHTEISRLGITGVGSHRLVQFLVAGTLLLPTAVGLGALFPMALQMGRPSHEEVGNWTGRLYAWNTFGAILGSASTAFFLLPLLGIQGSLGVGVLFHWAAATFLFWSGASAREGRGWIPAVWVGGCLVVLLLPRWNSHRLAMGPYDNLRYVKVDRLKDLQHPSEVRRMLVDRRVGSMELLHYREGISSTVSVERNAYPSFLILFNNGKPEASTQTDLGTQQLIAHLPLLWFEVARGRPAKEVGMVGLASGISAGAALQHGLERLTVAEIEPSMPEAARIFKEFNFDALSDPRLRFLADDGRHHLEVRPGAFDVVISEPSNPWISGVANLFTKEAFETGRRALGPGGVFCQWVQAYNMDISGLKTIVRTFRSVFPQAFLFGVPPPPGGTEPGPDLILVGSVEPLEPSIKGLERLMGEERLRIALQRIGIHQVKDLVGLLRMGPSQMDRFAGEGPLNTDDNCLIEYAAPNWFYQDTRAQNLAEVERFRTDPGHWVRKGSVAGN